MKKHAISRVLAPPGPPLTPPVLEFWSGFRCKKHSIYRVLAPPAPPPTPPVLEFWRGFRCKKHVISLVLAPPGRPGGRGLGNWAQFSPLPFVFYLILYRLTVLLGKRLQQPPAQRPFHYASPRRAGGRRTSHACGICRRPLGAIDEEEERANDKSERTK